MCEGGGGTSENGTPQESQETSVTGAEEEFEEMAKGHIFKVSWPWLDLVEQ